MNSVVDTGGNFATNVVDIIGKFTPGIVDTGEIFANLRKLIQKTRNGGKMYIRIIRDPGQEHS
jgi:hypothetical protein